MLCPYILFCLCIIHTGALNSFLPVVSNLILISARELLYFAFLLFPHSRLLSTRPFLTLIVYLLFRVLEFGNLSHLSRATCHVSLSVARLLEPRSLASYTSSQLISSCRSRYMSLSICGRHSCACVLFHIHLLQYIAFNTAPVLRIYLLAVRHDLSSPDDSAQATNITTDKKLRMF